MNSEYTVKYLKCSKKPHKMNCFEFYILTEVKDSWDKIIIEFSLAHYTNFEALPF